MFHYEELTFEKVDTIGTQNIEVSTCSLAVNSCKIDNEVF